VALARQYSLRVHALRELRMLHGLGFVKAAAIEPQAQVCALAHELFVGLSLPVQDVAYASILR
jgi:hypothetical protein